MDNSEYMVHFKFKLSPVDAENFGMLFTKDISDLYAEQFDAMADGDEKGGEWFEKRIKYIKELEHKVLGSSKAIDVDTGEVRIDSVNEWDKDW